MNKETAAYIEIKDLTKDFGHVHAIKKISLTLSKGTYGLIGPNGAGKTTLIKLILGLIRPTSGQISVVGSPPGSPKANAAIGYLSENMGYPEDQSPVEYLTFFGQLYGISEKKLLKMVDTLLEKMNLTERKDDPISTFSKGMRQRLGVARAMLHEPDLYILDEPLSGLDPTGRKEVLQALKILKDEGKTMLISSHELKDMDVVCDRICVMKTGTILIEGTPLDLLSRDEFSQEILTFNIHTPTEVLSRLQADIPEIQSAKYDNNTLIINIKHNPVTERKILSWLLENKVDFSQQKHVIDSIYSQLFKGGE
jgi:ABC-2 type transport system ATP-binding protein